MTTGESGGIGDGHDMDEWQPASVALGRRTPHLAALSSVGIFPVLSCRLDALGYPWCRASLSAEYGCTPQSTR